MTRWPLAAGAVLALGCAGAASAPVVSPQAAPGSVAAAVLARDYLVLIASEATDEITLARFGAGAARAERVQMTGFNPSEPDGPHGLAVAPGGSTYFVTTAHGTPFGYLWKYTTATGALLGRVELGSFPASMQVTPDGHYVYVVNFNLHGDMVPSSVSIVAAEQMLEVARVETCTMPHGSRLNAAGTRHYSACMMDEALVEIDATRFTVARHFILTKGGEHGMAGTPAAHAMGAMSAPPAGKCSPTWAQPSPDGTRVFVACNASNEIVEVDVASWTVVRRIPAGTGVYNLAFTHDGTKLIATNKRAQSVSVFDLASGRELARIPTKRRFPHGAVTSDDDRYAFVSVEGYGSEPGTLEMIDLQRLERVASLDVGQMAGGLDFWRSEARR
jgi:DNA-binding beta-propeller fold protein YncE